MKESQLKNPLGVTGFQRYTMKAITLLYGTIIPPPPHTFLKALVEATHPDPERYYNPETFDPYRYYSMRQKDDSPGKHQFVTLGTDVLSFGIGKHVCPSPFFAANKIKLIMINILRKFDIEQKEKGPRYANISYSTMNSADSSRELISRRIEA